MTNDPNKPAPKNQRGRKRALPPYARFDQFYSILPEGKYMFIPTRTLWDAAQINSLLGSNATRDLDKKRGCSQLVWAPGEPLTIEDRIILKGAWRDAPGNRCFNLYVPPDPIDGDPTKAFAWINLGRKLFGVEDAEHLMDWIAHRLQFPHIKINHALVLGSHAQGIGKDSWLWPVGHALGKWNWCNVSARKAYNDAAGFNSFLESVILQISEAHDLEKARFAFYDMTKDWCAAPPETLMVADKHVKAHPILNVVGVIYTTNHKTDGLYIPADDRRHFVAWSDLTPSYFPEGYWTRYWDWVKNRNGWRDIAAMLATRDVSKFDPYQPPRKTAAWHSIVAAGAEPQDAELLDVLESLGVLPGDMPDAITVHMVANAAPAELGAALLKNKKMAPHRFEDVGYASVHCPDRKDGLWRVNGRRQMIYARRDLPREAQMRAARELAEAPSVSAISAAEAAAAELAGSES